ncbi:MAG: hypothetical protein AVDCRST_MAG93-343 [uncultured Chloroflexia bacterium]|uniref:CHRD domain-containing protein n=1 Tax=uncultured Chloroflexia bacterium TaxID=1672391 RepID=A0A6J4HA63_9CHLR|nr:MAG: hypothetical protein AVDCRST_MAG93-343 [uncultured Chloroflexia bacterium]
MRSMQLLKVAILVVLAALVISPLNALAAQDDATQISVELQEVENSGISGTAVLTATLGVFSASLGGDTQVSMELRGAELDGNHPTHIHTGTCDDFDPDPLYPLQTVELSAVDREGISETTVEDVTLESLREGDFVILVHQSPEELTKYLVCGEIGAGTAGQAERVTSAEQEQSTSKTGTSNHDAATADHSKTTHGKQSKATEAEGKAITLPKAGSGTSTTAGGTSDIMLLTGLGALSLLILLSSRVLKKPRA